VLSQLADAHGSAAQVRDGRVERQRHGRRRRTGEEHASRRAPFNHPAPAVGVMLIMVAMDDVKSAGGALLAGVADGAEGGASGRREGSFNQPHLASSPMHTGSHERVNPPHA